MRAPVRSPGRASWTEVLGPDPAERRTSAQVFAGHVVLEVRRDFRTGLRVLDRTSGTSTEIWPATETTTLELATNEEYRTGFVTVLTESLVDPQKWHDVDLATGAWRLRKRQEIPGYDPSQYRTSQIMAPAADGTPVPVAGLPGRSQPGQDESVPAVRVRRIRGVPVPGIRVRVSKRVAVPARPRLGVRGSAHPRWR